MSAPEAGVVEDGTASKCVVCGRESYMYPVSRDVCLECEYDGWAWTKAYLIRAGDVCMLNGYKVMIVAEESLGKGVMLHGRDGREYPRRNLTGVLVRTPL